MKLVQTETFEKDIKKLDGSIKERLKKAIQKIIDNPEGGKPLKHHSNVFSERIEQYRLIYKISREEILLIYFKKRDEVYQYLKDI